MLAQLLTAQSTAHGSEEHDCVSERGGQLAPAPLLLREGGAFVPRYRCGWSAFYDVNPRRPDLTHMLPPYVAKQYSCVPGVGEVGWFGDAVDAAARAPPHHPPDAAARVGLVFRFFPRFAFGCINPEFCDDSSAMFEFCIVNLLSCQRVDILVQGLKLTRTRLSKDFGHPSEALMPDVTESLKHAKSGRGRFMPRAQRTMNRVRFHSKGRPHREPES